MSEPKDWEELLLEQLDGLLTLVERTGTQLRDEGAVLEEHGGSFEDWEEILIKHATLGDGMIQAVKRTREKLRLDDSYRSGAYE